MNKPRSIVLSGKMAQIQGRHFDLRSLGFVDTYASTRVDGQFLKEKIVNAITRNTDKVASYNLSTKKFTL